MINKKQAKVVVLRDETTSPECGKRPFERSLSERLKFGIVNINKPQGPSSHQVSANVKQILGVSKAGHSGTLDPNVTGCLVVALNSASRVNQFLLKAGKEYTCLLRLHAEIGEEKAREVVGSLVGSVKQVPPVRSAVKRVLREREVYYIDILEVDPHYVLFRVGCQAGTYIRKLCTEIGEKAGIGAHMQQLIRTKAGPFNVEESVSLVDLQDAYVEYKEGNDKALKSIIQPPEKAVSFMKGVWVGDRAVGNIAYGSDLFIAGVCKMSEGIEKGEIVAVYSLKDELVAVGEASTSGSGVKSLKKGVFVKTHKIFMERGIYPR